MGTEQGPNGGKYLDHVPIRICEKDLEQKVNYLSKIAEAPHMTRSRQRRNIMQQHHLGGGKQLIIPE